MKSILKDVEHISFFKLVPTVAPRLVGMLFTRMLSSGTPTWRNAIGNDGSNNFAEKVDIMQTFILLGS